MLVFFFEEHYKLGILSFLGRLELPPAVVWELLMVEFLALVLVTL